MLNSRDPKAEFEDDDRGPPPPKMSGLKKMKTMAQGELLSVKNLLKKESGVGMVQGLHDMN